MDASIAEERKISQRPGSDARPRLTPTRLRSLRIGYVPYSDCLDQCGDRCRFCYYAEKRGLKFEIAKPSQTYDVVIVTEHGDLSVWGDYRKGNAKLVYDIIDAYLAIPRSDIKGLLRGLAKYVARQNRYLQWNHRKAVETIARRADAVICNTEEQKHEFLKFCDNVHIILDVHSAVSRTLKTSYASGDVFNLVWQGLPQNVQFFHEIRDVLRYLRRKYPLALHIVTQLEYRHYLGKYWKRYTADIARGLFDEVYLYQWNEQMCSTLVNACDLALIPIPLDNPFAAGKSENKLLLFWRMGMPTVVSATPTYVRAMTAAGVPMACRTPDEWKEVLERYITDAAARQLAGQRGRAFAEAHHSEEKILGRWDDLFASVLAA